MEYHYYYHDCYYCCCWPRFIDNIIYKPLLLASSSFVVAREDNRTAAIDEHVRLRRVYDGCWRQATGKWPCMSDGERWGGVGAVNADNKQGAAARGASSILNISNIIQYCLPA